MFAPALIALFAANGLIPTASAGLLINEILYDAAGADDGLEWVEICNSGSSAIDLTGYQLESAGSSWSESYTFGAGSLAHKDDVGVRIAAKKHGIRARRVQTALRAALYLGLDTWKMHVFVARLAGGRRDRNGDAGLGDARHWRGLGLVKR